VDASAAVVRIPIRGTVLRGCAVTVSGAASKLRVSVTMHPTARYHMVVSFGLIPTCFFPAKPNAHEVSETLYQRHRRVIPHALNIAGEQSAS